MAELMTQNPKQHATPANQRREQQPQSAMVPRSGGGPSLFADLWGWDPVQSLVSRFAGDLQINRTEQGAYVVEIPVAGYTPEQIQATYQDGVIQVSGQSERRRFTRSLVLPEEIDPETIGTTVEHGLLTLTLQPYPQHQPKQIPVQAGSTGA